MDSFEGKVENFAVKINDVHTELVLIHFPNCMNLMITQFGKIGNLYQVKIDQPENGVVRVNPVYTISTVFGGENIQAEVAARYLTERLKIKIQLLISLCLKNYERDTLDRIIRAIQSH